MKIKTPSLVTGLALLVYSTAVCTAAQTQPSRQLQQNRAQRSPASKRLALVIGNGAYTNAPTLKNPPNDARDMASTLKELGFEVTSGINVNQRDMKRLIREFGQKLKSGGSGLFYYAGHGVQSKGRNYLIPVDADIQSEAEVEDSGVDVSLVLNYMDDAQNGLNIVILDACRNNPFSRSFRSASDGLAQVDAPTGTLIAYATAPGRVASDGTGHNGLYTSELLKQMRVPSLSVTDMFMRVRAEVMKETGNKQVPWESSSLVGSFYFSGREVNPSSTNSSETLTRIDPAAVELAYWESIKNSTNPEDFKAYLHKYTNGQFSELAKNRIETLSRTITPNTSTAVAGSWTIPETSGDANCLDMGCKAIRSAVIAAPTNFKADDLKNVPGFYCRTVVVRSGFTPARYACNYQRDWTKRVEQSYLAQAYDKYLNALTRALPGWFFVSGKTRIGDRSVEVAAAGPSQCTIETCPVKLRLFDTVGNYTPLEGILSFEIEAPHAAAEDSISESYKDKFVRDIRALIDGAVSGSLTDVAPDFICKTNTHADQQPYTICLLPSDRAKALYELAKQVMKEKYPSWNKDEVYADGAGRVGQQVTIFPDTCIDRGYKLDRAIPQMNCGLIAGWEWDAVAAGFKLTIRGNLPPSARR